MAPPAGSSAPPLAAPTVSDLLTAAARTPGAGGLVSCALRQNLGAPAAAASAASAAPGAAAMTPAGGSSPAPVPPTEVVAGRSLCYATLDTVASALAAALATTLPTPGERVAVLAPTGVVALAYLFAAARVAAVSVPLNTRWVRLCRVGGGAEVGGGRGGGRKKRARRRGAVAGEVTHFAMQVRRGGWSWRGGWPDGVVGGARPHRTTYAHSSWTLD